MFEELAHLTKQDQRRYWRRPDHDASEGRLRAMARHYFISMGTRDDQPHLHLELQKSLNFLNKDEGALFTSYLNQIIKEEEDGV